LTFIGADLLIGDLALAQLGQDTLETASGPNTEGDM